VQVHLRKLQGRKWVSKFISGFLQFIMRTWRFEEKGVRRK
jgi:hypothetical protein